ncbi:MAG: 2,3-bisphosphoglycerate-independent phosphoglycerate mutase [Chloroflexi bacterium]|nr:2,3-bisphosphoglycerate-independent phosphoglycerate mutase [Chloroflexota bacterium]
MIDFPYLSDIAQPSLSRIVMLVVDGLGGLPHPDTRRSELETAHLPNLNRLAQESASGLTVPVLPGVAPGSGPGHLALFGYDPVKYLIGRGVLEALGIGLEMQPGDVAARGNFCTVDGDGRVIDRRAGRIPSEEAEPLCRGLSAIKVPGKVADTDLSVHHVKDYRFVLMLRGQGLSDRVSETDSGRLNTPPLESRTLAPEAEATARAVNAFVAQARRRLQGRERANMVLLRGFSQLPHLPSMADCYRLHPAAIAAYPMYRGLAKIVGMEVIPTGATFQAEVATLAQHFQAHDFFYIHYKPADAAGEDGDFEAKVKALEALDTFIPAILELKPDVFVVTGDHATPALLASHSWHPVPTLVHSQWTRGEGVPAFHERACAAGSLGRLPAANLMFLVLAHAGKLAKFGP